MYAFKVWDLMRNEKVFVTLEDCGDDKMIFNLIVKASEKLKIDGSTLVLEADGTLIDEDSVLRLLQKEVLILLTKEERWQPATSLSVSFVSLASTETVSSPRSSTNLSFTDENTDNEQQSTGYIFRWDDFEIPWNRLSKSVISECEEGSRASDCLIKVLNCVVDAVREITKYAEMDKFRTIAKKMVQRYPKQFTDIDDDGVVIGNGYHTVLKRLVDRNNYLNRAHKRPANATVKQDVPPGKRRKMLSKKAGCSNWQPEIELEQPETLQEKKEFLKAMDGNLALNEQTLKCLNDTYNMQRLFLNNYDAPTISKIKEEWPILLLEHVTYWHFEKLTGKKISDLQEKFSKKGPKILQFGLNNRTIISIAENDTKRLIQCLQIICNFFKEDLKILVNNLDEEDTSESYTMTTAPCIKVVGGEGDAALYLIYIEKQEILQCKEFMSAFKLLFCFFYNFNMCYPKELSHTLQFIQMYFFKVYPDIGTKSKKKGITKVVSLINKLKKEI